MDVIVPLLTWAVIGGLTLAALSTRVPPAEQSWLGRTLMIALVLRLLTATMFALFPETRLFHEDAIGYELNGMHIAASWVGDAPPIPQLDLPNLGWMYICAAVYAVGGRFQVAPSYLNGLLGTVTIFLVYRLTRQFFHPIVARAATRLCVFIPSMILWNSMALKDTVATFLIVVSLSGCVSLKRRFSPGALLVTAVPIVLMQPIRFYMVYFLAFAVVLSLVLDRGAKVFTGVPKQLLVAGSVIALLAMTGLAGRAQEGTDVLSLSRVSSFREGMASTANSGFGQGVDVSTPGGALMFLPIGLAVLLLGPFPWQFGSVRALLAAPETILWWALIPSLIRGLRYAFKTQFGRISPVMLFAGILTVAYSLVHGNVGSGFRQRAQIFVFLFIFAALGWYLDKCKRARIDVRHLLAEGPP